MNTPRPRFTLCCLNDLGLGVPKLPDRIDDIDHPLLRAAQQMWTSANRPTERIASIDDVVLLKCKPNVPWRAAVWEDRDEHNLPWLVTAGPRQEGSRDDFYRTLARTCQTRRKRLNEAGRELDPGKKTYSKHLLPTADDRLRLAAERAHQAVADARRSVAVIVEQARRNPGSVVAGNALGADLEVLVVRNDLDELYLLINVVASAPREAHQVILSLAVPGLEAGDWQPVEYAPHRSPRRGEVAWYTLLEVPRLHR